MSEAAGQVEPSCRCEEIRGLMIVLYVDETLGAGYPRDCRFRPFFQEVQLAKRQGNLDVAGTRPGIIFIDGARDPFLWSCARQLDRVGPKLEPLVTRKTDDVLGI